MSGQRRCEGSRETRHRLLSPFLPYCVGLPALGHHADMAFRDFTPAAVLSFRPHCLGQLTLGAVPTNWWWASGCTPPIWAQSP